MRRRLLLAKWGFVLSTGTVAAQLPPFPQTTPPAPQTQPQPRFPSPALPMPPAQTFPGQPVYPGQATPNFPAPTTPGTLPPPATLPPLRSSMPLQQPEQPGLPNQAQSRPGMNLPPGPMQPAPIAQPQEIPLPYAENRVPLSVRDVSLKRVSGGWQLWSGFKMIRDFGEREVEARDTLRVYKDLRPTEWVTIGSPKPVVEYALVDGKPPMTLGVSPKDQGSMQSSRPDANGFTVTTGSGGSYNGPPVTGAGASHIVPIDMRTVRVEAVRGVWCLRDDDNIHFNFGAVKADADQSLAVVRRYGFNRIGIVGQQNAPMMSYFFVGSDEGQPAKVDKGPYARAALQGQIENLSRVGIPVAGVGFVGEMVKMDPRKLDVRKDGGEWVVASGTEVIGRFGPTEWAARDAARTLSDGRFTEFCRVGSAGLTFFLVNGKAPTRVPFTTQGRRFDPGALKVQPFGGHFAVTENGRHLFDCATAEEGDTLLRLVKHYGFDQLCHVGPSAKVGVSFLAKGQ